MKCLKHLAFLGKMFGSIPTLIWKSIFSKFHFLWFSFFGHKMKRIVVTRVFLMENWALGSGAPHRQEKNCLSPFPYAKFKIENFCRGRFPPPSYRLGLTRAYTRAYAIAGGGAFFKTVIDILLSSYVARKVESGSGRPWSDRAGMKILEHVRGFSRMMHTKFHAIWWGSLGAMTEAL